MNTTRWHAAERHLTRRNLRLSSGLVLFAYVATHLANHAVGLVSLQATDIVSIGFVAAWRSLPGTALLYGAAATHIALALVALYERRTLRLPGAELVRIVLGFSIPFLLVSHATGTRIAYELYGQADSYARVVWSLWSGDGGARQLLLMVLAWTHGCLGIHFLLRYRSWYRRRFHLLFAGAVLLPLLAALGFFAMAKEISARAADRAWFEANVVAVNVMDAAKNATLDRIEDTMLALLGLLLVGVVLARALRALSERRGNVLVAIAYPERIVQVPRGWSVLEASRAHGIPHMSLCGGRARCSTCRVRVVDRDGRSPPPGADERRTLDRIRAPENIRLGCQLRPEGDIGVTPLLTAVAPASGSHATSAQFGVEREVVVMFTDVRRWTSLAEQHLPYDLVYVINQYFAAIGDAVRAAGGVPNQFIGDSVMAIFGLDADLPTACRQALTAACGIEPRMRALNERMQREFGQTLGFGIGLHAGPAAVGEVGYRDTRALSAVGDTTNTTSRLQELTKKYGAQLVLSEVVARGAGLDITSLPTHELEIRGRSTPLRIYVVESLDVLERLASPPP